MEPIDTTLTALARVRAQTDDLNAREMDEMRLEADVADAIRTVCREVLPSIRTEVQHLDVGFGPGEYVARGVGVVLVDDTKPAVRGLLGGSLVTLRITPSGELRTYKQYHNLPGRDPFVYGQSVSGRGVAAPRPSTDREIATHASAIVALLAQMIERRGAAIAEETAAMVATLAALRGAW